MAWQTHGRYWRLRDADERFSLEGLSVNEQCFIRKEHRCGKIVGASKSCFIACPTDEELKPILELMSEKLNKVGIEPIIAIWDRAYGQDIFCTKICGKIIESNFCIVILNDTKSKKIPIPNPNVYYEYGLMTSMRKHIIPLQKEKQELAFNIQSYDTIKYNSSNIGSELERAIRDAIGLSGSKNKKSEEQHLLDKSILRALELAGLQPKEDAWVLSDAMLDTAFKGFGQYEKGFYAFVGRIDKKEDMQTYLDDLDIVTFRANNKFMELERQVREHKRELTSIKEFEKKRNAVTARLILQSESYEVSKLSEKIKDLQSKLQLMKIIYVGFIVANKIDVTGFGEKANFIIKDRKRFRIALSENNELSLGDIRVSFDRFK